MRTNCVSKFYCSFLKKKNFFFLKTVFKQALKWFFSVLNILKCIVNQLIKYCAQMIERYGLSSATVLTVKATLRLNASVFLVVHVIGIFNVAFFTLTRILLFLNFVMEPSKLRIVKPYWQLT